MKNAPHHRGQVLAWTLGLSLAAAGLAPHADAAVWTYTNKTSTAWSNAVNWNPNSIPPLGVNNYPGRFNVSAATPAHAAITKVVYDSPLTTGFGTIVNASPEFGRGLSVGNGTGTTGTLEVVSGTLNIYQAALSDAAIVCAPGNATSTSRGYLILNGGNLTVIATNYGVLSFPFRGNASSLGVVTVQNGSTLKVDRLRFGGTGAYNDIGVDLPGVFNLNSGGTALIRNIANILRPENLRATNNFDGGILKLLASETAGEGRNPLIGSNIVNNLLAGGLVVDTAGFDGRIVSPLFNGIGGADGGVTKTGAGKLNLYGPGSTYTGPTIVNAGTLGVQVPMTSSDFRVAPNATLNFITDNLAAWSIPVLNLTNMNLGFDYGNYAGYSSAVVSVGTLRVQGTLKINLVGTSFPVTTLTLLTYGSKTGGGSITLGALPTGAQATLEDTGSALLLHITSASLQALTWTASINNTWQANGAANWNFGTATYLEYPSGVGDIVTFDDSSFGTVNLGSIVRPTSVTVSAVGSSYTFSGTGGINGPTALLKEGAGTLQLSTSNDYLGITTINGGMVYADNAKSLGATNEGTVVVSGATLAVGIAGGTGVTIAGEAVEISGAGLGGAFGALRGGATASGVNVWAGPVTLNADNSRIGTEDSGNLTISGDVTDRNSNYGVVLRPGVNGVLRLSGLNNSWGGASQVFGGGSGKLVFGSPQALPAGSALLVGEGILDVNGFSPTAAGLALNGGAAGNAIIRNDGPTPATLTLNPLIARNFPGNLMDGTATLGLVKSGTNVQVLSGYNTYTGPTVVNGGELGITLPSSSTALTVTDGASLTLGVAGMSWTLGSAVLTNATLNLNYGTVYSVPPAVLAVGSLRVSGSNVVNLTVTNLPVGQTPLITYTSKSGTGTFHLGPLPVGVVATIVDTGSAIVLDVTVSAQTLTWYGFTSGTWNTNGTLDWNFGANAYQEYGPAGNRVGDFVVFDDNAAVYAVNVTTDVRPYSITVNNPVNPYTFSGAGKIGGATTLTKSGAGALSLTTPNVFTGGTAVRGGGLDFVSGALGSAGNVTVANSGTLRWADGNSQDISSRLRIDGATGTPATLDVGTNDLTFASGINQNSTGGTISNAVTKVGSGKLIFGGASAIGQVVRLNAGAVEVPTGASLLVDGNATLANAALVVDRSTLTISGGAVIVGDRLGIASAGTSTGVVTVASGSVTVDTGSGETTHGLRLAGGSSTAVNDNDATVNLDGGTLTASRVFAGMGVNNSSVFNFNGGTLKPGGTVVADAFMTNLRHAYVKSGGAVIDTAGSDITIGQVLESDGVASPDGGLKKLGAGVLMLAGANSYTGPTVVSNGTLHVSGTLGPSAVTVAAGGTLAFGTDGALDEVLNLSSTLHLAGTVLFQIGATPACDRIAGVTDVVYGGTLAVTNAAGATLAPGDVFTLFSASGAKTGNFSSVQVLPASLGLSGTFNPATGQLTLANAAPPTLSFVNTGSALRLSWTGSYRLQAQTNALSAGIGINWHDYPSGGSSPVTVPLDAAQGSVFFRLVSP